MSRLALTFLVVLALAGSVTASGADFTASSSSTSSFAAAADFNTVAVSLTNPGTPLTNTVGLTATASSERGIASVVFQAAPAGTSDWVTLCTDNVAPYTCSWNTLSVADDTYDLRATATDTAGYAKTSTVSGRVVDNYTLTVTLTDPGAMSGTESLTATAANAAGGGIQSLKIQHRAVGATSWTDVCSGTTNPRTCGLDTTALPNGGRELRAVVTDLAGQTAQSTMITRTVDNTPPTATPSVPSSGTGTVNMSADAQDDGSGIAYVAFEAFYMGQWYEFCRDTTAPYTCSGDSAAVPDGTYSIRVVVENNAGVKTTSSPSSITIDNPPKGTDIATGNGGATVGRLEGGDWVRLTWTEQIAPASVLSGWAGGSQAVRVRITEVGTNDQMDFWNAAGTTRLNLVSTAADLKLGGNYVTGTTEFNATMTQSGSSITVTLTGSPNPNTVNTVVAANTMTWVPSAAALDLTGHASSTALVTEAGTDVDF
ncbi:MAG TPA: Ig-like domain-containing protein [Solirubrobacteraceae bacterium]|nr:Ig-like domain-containing protein [Solirubrobacteraceae bacterium]